MEIKPIDKLRGQTELPGDKSISHRVAIIGAVSEGKTRASNFLESEDCKHTVDAFRGMGIFIDIKKGNITIEGKGLKGLKKPKGELYLGNSGTSMRLIPGILAGQDFDCKLTGDESLAARPMNRIVEPLVAMGVDISTKDNIGRAPIFIKGGEVKPIRYRMPVASAQVKSCILLAGLYAHGKTSVVEPFKSRDHTERMLAFFGADINVKSLEVSVSGTTKLSGKKLLIPGDISSAAFFIAAASILEGSDIVIKNIGLNPTRTGFISALLKMGADIKIKEKSRLPEPFGELRVRAARLKGIEIKGKDIPFLIDEVPILAVVASLSEGKTVIKGISELRVKETDRVFSMVSNLTNLGREIKAAGNDLIISGKSGRFRGGKSLATFKDHRTAMCMAIASLASDKANNLDEVRCINTSFPEFFDILGSIKE